MCGNGCSQNEECRYDKTNCEYKCYVISRIMIGATIGAVAGALIIGIIIFFVIRHFRSNAKVKNTTSVEKQPDYEVPYQYNMNRNDDQNKGVNIENEETYEA